MKYFATSEFTKTDFIKCRRFDKTKSKFLNFQFDFRTPLHELALSIKLLKLGSVGQFLSKVKKSHIIF
jgi:hypothetical protein